MNVDLEAGGALATAGLAAHEIESHSQPAKGEVDSKQTCANCKSILNGPFCVQCGQSAHVHRSLWHMGQELLHGILHFDAKSWRTLPLLVARPGLLTRRYIEGQRVRYVSPLALFLFSTFLMFFVLSLFNHSDNVFGRDGEQSKKEARAEILEEIQATQKKANELKTTLAGSTTAEQRADITEDLEEAVKDQKASESTLGAIDKRLDERATEEPAPISSPAEQTTSTNINIETGNKKLDQVIVKARNNPELLAYKFKNTAYKFSFMLIPISLPFLWLMFFWRRGITMYDHAIFSLYSLSFMSIFFILVGLVSEVFIIKGVVGYMMAIPPMHMFIQLKETYRLGIWSALWRTLTLLLVAGLVFVLFFILVGRLALN